MPQPPESLRSPEAFAEFLARRNSDPTPADVVAGLREARSGRVVSLGDAPATPALPAGWAVPAATPSAYRLSQWTETGDGWEAVNDRIELDIHGATSMTHLDTIAHFSTAASRATGDPLIELAATGIVGRGILIDVSVGEQPIQPGQVITLADVERTVDRCGLEPRAGDVLHLDLGRRTAARSDVALGSVPTSGLSIECAEWLADLSPAAVVTDEGLDPFPSEVSGVLVPWHLLVLTALHIPLIDRARFDALSAACLAEGRWSFLSVIAPLAIPGASGSPVNPLAVL